MVAGAACGQPGQSGEAACSGARRRTGSERSERRIPRDEVARNVTGQGTAHLVRRTLHPLVLLFVLHKILRGVSRS